MTRRGVFGRLAALLAGAAAITVPAAPGAAAEVETSLDGDTAPQPETAGLVGVPLVRTDVYSVTITTSSGSTVWVTPSLSPTHWRRAR